MEKSKSKISVVGPSRYLTYFVESGYNFKLGCPGCSGSITINLGPVLRCVKCHAVIKVCPEVAYDYPSFDF